MELRSRFVAELKAVSGGRFHDLSPSRVADAVRRALGHPGAGIVMLHRLLRVPVGAAGEQVALAEQLQVTLGEGPCLASADSGRAFASSETQLAQSWPVYRRALVAATPYRSTLSFPLLRGGRVFAALDVYGRDPEPHLPAPLAVIAAEVADLVAPLLLAPAPRPEDPHDRAAGVRVQQREQVQVALGMLMEAAEVEELDALALMRGYAFRTGTLLDTVAGRMTGGALAAADVLEVG
ncbi:GAF domain-containing protein [Microlunatus flavus]|uniref:GAF domain-containing protein n=1 Tax=Microlunatus flavus TaxID=1036181 RepID=A0A1H9AN83_9ACTN|nr:GAF domain-containing protein [Microlunatus flavus]SEP78234.1 GAF domain-containing protein [Microlunatus flavus]